MAVTLYTPGQGFQSFADPTAAATSVFKKKKKKTGGGVGGDGANRPASTPRTDETPGVETFRDSETGAPTGFTYKGKTYFGGNAPEIRGAVQRLVTRNQQPPGTELVGTSATPQEIAQAEQVTAGQLSDAGVFDPLNQASNLIPSETSPESIIPGVPNIPSTRAVLNQGVLSAMKDGLIDIDDLENYNDPMLQELLLNELEKELIQSGEAVASKFGAFVEGIPAFGGLARKYGGSLITTPSSQIDDINSNIDQLETQLTRWSENVNAGYVDPGVVFSDVEKVESDVRRLEATLRLLMMQSAELQSSPEEINKIQDRVQRVYNVIFQVRQRAAGAQLSALEPDADKAYLKLREFKGKNENNNFFE